MAGKQAVATPASCESLNLFWLEKPVQPDDVWGCREVKSVPDISVATGENLDELVYQLYGITDEERRIIEGAWSSQFPRLTPWAIICLDGLHGLRCRLHSSPCFN